MDPGQFISNVQSLVAAVLWAPDSSHCLTFNCYQTSVYVLVKDFFELTWACLIIFVSFVRKLINEILMT